MKIVNTKDFNKDKDKIEKKSLLLCPNCNTKMKRFLKSACLECPHCKEVYHVETLVYPKGDKGFETEDNALMFLEELLNEEK
jgi:protein-arginine kinase activator protein McsA